MYSNERMATTTAVKSELAAMHVKVEGLNSQVIGC